MNNIIEHPAVTAEKVESLWSVAGSELNLGEIHAGLSLDHYAMAGAALASLRDQNPTNIKFGVACAEHEIFLKPQMRAAVIWWGRLSDDQRETLVDWFPASLTPKSLQDRCREEKPEWLKFEKNSVIPSGDNAIENPPTPEIQPNTTPIEPEQMNQPEENCQEVVKIEKCGRTYLAVVSDYYKHTSDNRIKNVFGNKLSAFAKIILSGVLGETSEYRFSSHNVLAIRSFYPDYPNRWRFGEISGLKLIDAIDDIVEHHARCGNDFSKKNCKDVLKEMGQHDPFPPTEFIPIISSLQSEPSHIIKGSCIPINIQDIVVAGYVVWSEENTKGVEYNDAWATYQLFKRMIDNVHQDERQDWARHSMNLGKYMHMIMLESACSTWTQIANAVYKNPEKYESETSGSQPATNHA